MSKNSVYFPMTQEQAEDVFVRFFGNMPVDQFQNDQDLVVQLQSAFYYFFSVYKNSTRDPDFPKQTAEFFKMIPQFHQFLPKSIVDSNRYMQTAQVLTKLHQKLCDKAIACGCICYNPELTHVLVVHHSMNKKFFGFPKGKMTEGESYLSAACRETLEESGVDVSPYITDQYMFTYSRSRNRSDVYMFHVKNVPMDLTKTLMSPSPLEIGIVRWVQIDQIGKEERYSPLPPTVAVLPIIQQFVKDQLAKNE